MIVVRKADERGRTEASWLDSRHTFSFAEYYDPRFMQFRHLRVINEDRIAPGGGFPTHGHRDMEIITYILDGALEHRDSLGNGSVIRPGEIQRMSAGSGIMHSEFNPSRSEPTHLLQIWLLPERNGLAPGYEQRVFDRAAARHRLLPIAGRAGGASAVTVHQDVELAVGFIDMGKTVRRELAPGRYGWLQVAKGALALNGVELGAGDGASISDEAVVELTAGEPSEVLLFDLA